MQLSKLLATFFPPQPYASLTEKLLSAVGALVAILALAWVTSRFLSPGPTLFMVASMGASAVLLFAASHSPLAQPWAFVGGHVLSALIGVACQQFIPDTTVATAAAVALSILAMHLLHCLHPPGGATALMPVLGGPEVQQLGYGFVAAPVAINAVVLLVLALIINNLLPGRRYPAFAHPAPKGKEPHELAGWPLGKFGIAQADLESALREMRTYIDVSEEDLEQIYAKASLHATRRRLGEIHVRDIMTREVVTVEYGDDLEQVWQLMREKKVKGVPVLDRARRVIGIVTILDFLKLVGPCEPENVFQRLCQMIRRTPGLTSDKAEVAGQVMTAPAITVREDAHIVTLIPLFSQHGIHHLPVVGADAKLAGLVTQSDLMEALYKLRVQLG
jgi:CBS domain-containing membrane protein